MKKRILCFILALVLCIPLCTSVVAQDAEENYCEFEVYLTEEEAAQELKAQIQKKVFETQAISRDAYPTKVEYGPIETRVLEGYVGGQLPEGYCFPKGGSIFYTKEGGPSVSAGVTFPPPFSAVSVSVTLGMKVNRVAEVCNIPADNNYYLVYREIDVQVQPYIVYKRTDPSKPWEVETEGFSQVTLRSKAYPVKVD